MVERFPQILGIIEEDDEGNFNVTIFLRTSPHLLEDRLLIDQPTGTIDEACGIISLVARRRLISANEVVIHIGLTDMRPSRGSAN